MTSSTASYPVTGILWMLLSGLCFVAVTALVKTMGTSIPPAEAAFLRYALGFLFLMPMLWSIRKTRLTQRQWVLFSVRGVLHSGGVILWFFAMTSIPLSEVTAMNYLTPVYVTIGAALFLGEKLAARRIMAIIAALIGVTIILRPGFREISPGHMAMLLAAVVFGGSYLLAKIAADEMRPSVVVTMMAIFVTLGLAPFAAVVWVTPGWGDLAILTGVAGFATAGHYAMTLAFRAASISVTQPVTFLQLIWATSLGALAFGEPVDAWVVAGGCVILGAVTFITWREAVLNRRVTPPSGAMKL